MKFPNHIILDVSRDNVSLSSQYWIYKYLLNFKTREYIFESLSFQKKFLLRKENLLLNKLLKNQKKFTLKYSQSNPSIFFTDEKNKLYNNLYKPKAKVKHKLLYSKNLGKEVYDYLNSPKMKFDEKLFKRILKNFSYKNTSKTGASRKLWNLFDINFLKKEKIYTKLKYSRVPQYDIVSGGVAAIFAGFLGFLICEKFGFELLDSGDFYVLFMYFVFLSFIARLFIRLSNGEGYSWTALSLKWFFSFYETLFILFIKRIKSLIK